MKRALKTITVGRYDLIVAVEGPDGRETVIIIRSSRGGDHIAQILALRRQLGLPVVPEPPRENARPEPMSTKEKWRHHDTAKQLMH